MTLPLPRSRHLPLLLPLLLCLSLGLASASYNVVPGKHFDHIFILIFENEGFSKTYSDPNFKLISDMGLTLSNFHAITHPSQPNYLALTSGDFYGINNNIDVKVEKSHVGDLMDQKGVSWITYQENFPGDCSSVSRIGDYVRKHNPFMLYTNVHNNKTRCNQRIVEAGQLEHDLITGSLPNYMLYTPNMRNDGHDTSIEFAGAYLKKFVDEKLSRFPPRTLFVVTFDEDSSYFSDNRILTVFLGDMITPGTENSNCHTLYSLLRLVEENWDLGNLGRNDATATPINITATGGPAIGTCGIDYWPAISLLLVIGLPILVITIIIIVIILIVKRKKIKRCCCKEEETKFQPLY